MRFVTEPTTERRRKEVYITDAEAEYFDKAAEIMGYKTTKPFMEDVLINFKKQNSLTELKTKFRK